MIVPSISNCITFYHLVKSSYKTPILMKKLPNNDQVFTEDDLNFSPEYDTPNKYRLKSYSLKDTKIEEYMNND